MYYNVALGRVRVTTVAVKKAISIAYSECVSASLVIRHANCLRRVILSCGLSDFTIFFPNFVMNDVVFGGGGDI